MVDKQNTDFWYLVNVPLDSDTTGRSAGKDDNPPGLLPAAGE
jgi:hypothetical protein